MFERKKFEQQENPGDSEVSILADLHKADDPIALIEKAKKKGQDKLVLNGDLTTSDVVQDMVDDFKEANDDDRMPDLDDAESELFEQYEKQGYPKIRAYMKAKFEANTELWQQEIDHLKETLEKYSDALKEFEDVVFIPGNVEVAYPEKMQIVQEVFAENGIDVVDSPRAEKISEKASILYWPSVDPQEDPAAAKEFEKKVPELANELDCKEKVFVLAHEQLFHGPPPERYLENVKESGQEATTVPRYMPNPTRDELLNLFKQLDEQTKIVYVGGHIHDPQKVVRSGFPLEEGEHGGMAWEYRTKDSEHDIEMFQAPANELAQLIASEETTQFNSSKV